jgi:DNA-directed RNA polymerase subunit RPC12/RpoP
MTNEEYRKMRGTDKLFGKCNPKPTNKIKANQLINIKEDEDLFELGFNIDDEDWDYKCPHCKFELIKPDIYTCPNCQRETGFVSKQDD